MQHPFFKPILKVTTEKERVVYVICRMCWQIGQHRQVLKNQVNLWGKKRPDF